jgi:hypothetical protein
LLVPRFWLRADKPVQPLGRQYATRARNLNTVIEDFDERASASNREILMDKCVGDDFAQGYLRIDGKRSCQKITKAYR